SQMEALAEGFVLAYVAMTRAEYKLYLSWDFASASEFSALGYLLQDPGQVQAQLKAKMGWGEEVSCPPDKMHQSIEELCTNYTELFTLEDVSLQTDENQLQLPNADPEHYDLRARRFKRQRPLNTSFHISSFSSLSSRMKDDPDLPDYDQYAESNVVPFTDAEANSEQTIFSFPKGPQPGTCIHNIFEELDFSDPGKAGRLVEENLRISGIDTDWKPVVSQMLETVAEKPLLAGRSDLRLSAIKPEHQLAEMEFYYRNDNISSQKLVSIIRGQSGRSRGSISTAAAGFLKGFIDLTFKFDGKYYILDYKTNYLGDSPADYSLPKLRQEMHTTLYDLQYHIY